LKGQEIREKFGKTARRVIKEKAEYEKEMGKMEKVYQEALKQL